MNELTGTLMMVQVRAPLLLILLNGMVSASTVIGWVVRTLGLALLVVLAARSGVWLFPPWWTPWLMLDLHLVLSVFSFRRLMRSNAKPVRWRKSTEVLLAIGLFGLAIVLLLPTLDGRRVPDQVVALHSPLAPGAYLVTSGGSAEAINSHLKTLNAEAFRAYRGQSYAVDLVAINRWGLRANGISPIDPSKYFIYGRGVVSPCSGRVAVAVHGIADMPVPTMDRDHMLGNHGCGWQYRQYRQYCRAASAHSCSSVTACREAGLR